MDNRLTATLIVLVAVTLWMTYADGDLEVSSSASATLRRGENGQPQAVVSSLSRAQAEPSVDVHTEQHGQASSTGSIGSCPPRPNEMDKNWGYHESEKEFGPRKWCWISPACSGMSQSPVALTRSLVYPSASGGPLKFRTYPPLGVVQGKMRNNGHVIGLEVDTRASPLVVEGGPLGRDVFLLKQFHFHFGCDGGPGSEHTLDGVRYWGEIHLVFSNSLYPDLNKAAREKDGLLEITAFMEPQADSKNKAITRITELVHELEKPGSIVDMTDGICLENLLPMFKRGIEKSAYFHYSGSLTTPPCSEVVTFVILEEVISIDTNITKFWDRLQSDHSRLCDNYRPLQPLNGRHVFHFRP